MGLDLTADHTRHELTMATDSEEDLLARAVLRLNGMVLGLVFGIVLGLLIFIATIWLVIKGGPVVGPHLGLLSQFFIGYRVTLGGSFIGLLYGLVTGFAIGWIVAAVYNTVAGLRK